MRFLVNRRLRRSRKEISREADFSAIIGATRIDPIVPAKIDPYLSRDTASSRNAGIKNPTAGNSRNGIEIEDQIF